MAHSKNISFTSVEYDGVRMYAEDHKGLKSLLKKMDKSRLSLAEQGEWPFSVQDALKVAREILCDKLTTNPGMNGMWYNKKNNFIKSEGILEEHFRLACITADNTWKSPVYFDTLLFQTMKLASSPVSTKNRPVVPGFADPNLFDDSGRY